MTRFFLITLWLLMLATAAFSQVKSGNAIAGQLKSLRADKTFEVVYDKSADNTKIIGFSDDFGKEENRRSNLQSFRFGLAVNFQGQSIAAAPDIYLLTFQAGTKKDKFRDAHALVFTIDNEVLDLGEARYGNKNQGVEYLNFMLTRQQLAKIAKGSKIQMKIGVAEFTLKPEQIKMFADLFALSDPTTL